jgi:hypothetical protein
MATEPKQPKEEEEPGPGPIEKPHAVPNEQPPGQMRSNPTRVPEAPPAGMPPPDETQEKK